MKQEIADPFAENVDADDPFATSEDVATSSGPFVPRPYLSDLAGRLVAMVPREFDPEAPKRADRIEAGKDETQERYIVDLVLLDGGELTFYYKSKVQDPKPGQDEWEEKAHTVAADEIPHLWTRVHREEFAIIGQLKKVDGKARPILLGRVRRGPQAADRRKGMTIDQVEEAWKVYEGHLKAGRVNATKPKFSWVIDVDGNTDADREKARAWYAKAKAEGFSL